MKVSLGSVLIAIACLCCSPHDQGRQTFETSVEKQTKKEMGNGGNLSREGAMSKKKNELLSFLVEYQNGAVVTHMGPGEGPDGFLMNATFNILEPLKYRSSVLFVRFVGPLSCDHPFLSPRKSLIRFGVSENRLKDRQEGEFKKIIGEKYELKDFIYLELEDLSSLKLVTKGKGGKPDLFCQNDEEAPSPASGR